MDPSEASDRSPEARASEAEARASEATRREHTANTTALFLTFAIGSLMLLGLVFAASQAVPASPLTVYSSYITPEVACPNQSIEVIVDYEIEPGFDVKRMEIESVWRPLTSEAGIAPEPGGTLDLEDVSPTERTVTVSSLIRSAPSQPGRYRLHTERDVAFEMYHIPRFQTVREASKNTLTVLGEEECG